MLKAIIFDCDGVIANTEPIHLAGFTQVLAQHGIALTKDDYLARYLALDDRGCFTQAFADHGASLSLDQLSALIRQKAEYVELAMRTDLSLLPGIAEFIRAAAKRYPLAVASGALRAEVETVLSHGGLRECFRVLVSAGDTPRSKPHPDPFIKALELLNQAVDARIEPGECLVIEDSIHGVRAAHQAQMRCIAITSSYPGEKLSEAAMVIDGFIGLSLEAVEGLLEV